MTDPELDLTISRVIRAPRAAVWAAWIDPESFARWWVPKPAVVRVAAWEPVPGGAFRTEVSEGGGEFGPQIDGCFVVVDELERIVFTTALVAGWRPAPSPFITGVFTFADHPDGTEYVARALHKDAADRAMHEDLGFYDGWGAVTDQLAALVEGRPRE